MRIGIIGAGFAGLSAAYDIASAGHEAVVFEANEIPGGLASGFRDERWDWHIEHYYHHLFTSDSEAIGLARETGFGDKILTLRPITGLQYSGSPYALDGVLPVLQFPGIPFIDRLRLGLVTAYLKVTGDWQSLENVTTHDWVRRWMGHRAYEVVWEPLLVGKFGADYRDVPMSWMWARLHKRSMRLIYFEGGFQAFADHLLETVTALGGSVRLGCPVEGIGRATGKQLSLRLAGVEEPFDRVIATTGPHQLVGLAPGLSEDYVSQLRRLKHLGAIVAILALDRKLMPEVYWLSLDKREFPFLACVEHTNFVDPAHYGGDHLVYIGDYLANDHPYFRMTDAELLDEWLPALLDINPDFDRDWIRKSWISRTSYAQPVVSLGSSKHIPSIATPLEGLYLASMSQVYPWDRGTNYAVEIGREAAALALKP